VDGIEAVAKVIPEIKVDFGNSEQTGDEKILPISSEGIKA
jgi:hypothetical protein